jgi:hypothetical protein
MPKFFSRKSLFSLLSAVVLCGAAHYELKAQTPASQAAINERFEIKIVQEKITETDFARSTGARLGEENGKGLKLEVGAGVRAERINALLRGIFGQVVFRASLESVRQRLDQRLKGTLPN